MKAADPEASLSRSSPMSIAGVRKAEQLLHRVLADPEADLATGVLGPGGCGKSALLSEIRRAYQAAGLIVAGVDALADAAVPTDVVILADDAHTLSTAQLQRLTDVVGRSGSKIVVAFRPWPRPPALTALASALRRNGPLTVLQHLGRAEVEARATAVLAQPVGPDWVELLTAQTGGQPLVLDEALATLLEAGVDVRTANPRSLPREVVERVRFLAEDLDGTTRGLLHAIAAGAKVETGVISALLGVDQLVVREAVEEARAGGFLLADGRLIPLFRSALLDAEPIEQTLALQVSLLDIHAGLGHDVVAVARSLAHSGIRNQRAATVLVAAADSRLRTEPATAASLYTDAVQAGSSGRELAVRRAEASLLNGRLDHALQLADPILAEEDAADLAHAVEVVATVMAYRGQLGRAVELYGWLGSDRIGALAPMAALALLGTGEPREAAAVMESPIGRQSPTMLAGTKALMVSGVQTSFTGSYTSALSDLSRAASMLESSGRMSLLLDSPAALAALVAINMGEFDLAESGLRRAVEHQVGGALASSRHVLLLAWIAMLRGRNAQATALLAKAAPTGSGLEPRDEIFATALRVGLARRGADQAELAHTWQAAREAIVRQPVDLFVLLPVGEFAIAAARLGESHLLENHLKHAWALLERLGGPGVWVRPLLWSCVQAAVSTNSPDEVRVLADTLAAITPTNGYGTTLALAAHFWADVLGGDVIEADAAQQAASALRDVGLIHEAAQLLSEAIARCADRRTAVTLLQAARALQGSSVQHDEGVDAVPPLSPDDVFPTDNNGAPVGRGRQAPRTANNSQTTVLSGRELQVAQLLLRNKTYREIGERLFISPKTVEHHVARMKQRIGASQRSDLFAELRVLTAEIYD